MGLLPGLDVYEAGGGTVVNFDRCPNLDEATMGTVGEQLFRLVDGEAPRELLILDFARLEYLTSTALGALMALHKRLQAKGGHLRLANLAPHLYEVFEVTRLNTVLDIRREALDSCPLSEKR